MEFTADQLRLISQGLSDRSHKIQGFISQLLLDPPRNADLIRYYRGVLAEIGHLFKQIDAELERKEEERNDTKPG